jgi:hypothetical protein
MTSQQQQELMIRFARCKFKFGAASYEEADCAGAAQLVYRDYAGIDVTDDRLAWRDIFDLLHWPVELQEWDILLLNSITGGFEVADHCGVYIGDGNVVHFGRTTNGMLCQRIERFIPRIASILRYNKK